MVPTTSKLVEEARRHALGEYQDKTHWNKIAVGNIEITVERGVVDHTTISSKKELIKFSPAYENRQNKGKCGLCKAYFDKKTMRHRVTNNRIIEQQKEWNVSMEGRRYNTTSFLYEATAVCTFCYQLFDDIDDESVAFHSGTHSLSQTQNQNGSTFDRTSTQLNRTQSMIMAGSGNTEPNILNSTSQSAGNNNNTKSNNNKNENSNENENKLNSNIGSSSASVNSSMTAQQDLALNRSIKSTTILERFDVAANKISYQSSVVDRLDAVFAVTPPYSLFAKTRRELDPWWELNLDRVTHIHSINFSIGTYVTTLFYFCVFCVNFIDLFFVDIFFYFFEY